MLNFYTIEFVCNWYHRAYYGVPFYLSFAETIQKIYRQFRSMIRRKNHAIGKYAFQCLNLENEL